MRFLDYANTTGLSSTYQRFDKDGIVVVFQSSNASESPWGDSLEIDNINIFSSSNNIRYSGQWVLKAGQQVRLTPGRWSRALFIPYK